MPTHVVRTQQGAEPPQAESSSPLNEYPCSIFSRVARAGRIEAGELMVNRVGSKRSPRYGTNSSSSQARVRTGTLHCQAIRSQLSHGLDVSVKFLT